MTGASNYTYAEATVSQKLHDWIASDVLDVAVRRSAIQRHTLVGEILLEAIGLHAETKLGNDHMRHGGGVKQRA